MNFLIALFDNVNLGTLANIAQISAFLLALIFGSELTLLSLIRGISSQSTRGQSTSGQPISTYTPRENTSKFFLYFFIAIAIIISVLLASYLGVIYFVSPSSQIIYKGALPTTPICAKGTIKIDGSSSLAKLVEPVSVDYQNKCQGSAIIVKSSDSGRGRDLVDAGAIQIGDSDTFATKQTQSDLTDHIVAVVVFAIILHKESLQGVKKLTTDAIQGIYNGSITNWNQVVGGPNLPIRTIGRNRTSGTHQSLVQFLLRGQEPSVNEEKLATDVEVAKAVQNTPGAIGYVDLITAGKYNVQIVPIDGILPTDFSSVQSNHYTFWNFEHMYTKRQPIYNSLTALFIDYMFSPAAKPYIHSLLFLSFNDMMSCALNKHSSPNDSTVRNCP